jgi:hypothetical protein
VGTILTAFPLLRKSPFPDRKWKKLNLGLRVVKKDFVAFRIFHCATLWMRSRQMPHTLVLTRYLHTVALAFTIHSSHIFSWGFADEIRPVNFVRVDDLYKSELTASRSSHPEILENNEADDVKFYSGYFGSRRTGLNDVSNIIDLDTLENSWSSPDSSLYINEGQTPP